MEKKFKKWFIYWLITVVLLTGVFAMLFIYKNGKELLKSSDAVPLWFKLLYWLSVPAAYAIAQVIMFRSFKRDHNSNYNWHGILMATSPALILVLIVTTFWFSPAVGVTPVEVSCSMALKDSTLYPGPISGNEAEYVTAADSADITAFDCAAYTKCKINLKKGLLLICDNLLASKGAKRIGYKLAPYLNYADTSVYYQQN